MQREKLSEERIGEILVGCMRLPACDTIDHAVRLEKGLTVFLDSKTE
jgi:hypothetical protein